MKKNIIQAIVADMQRDLYCRQMARLKTVLFKKLQDIEIRYGIKVVDDNTLFHLEAKKVDSALILLPVFRDKMAFNSTRSRWQISIETEKMNKK